MRGILIGDLVPGTALMPTVSNEGIAVNNGFHLSLPGESKIHPLFCHSPASKSPWRAVIGEAIMS